MAVAMRMDDMPVPEAFQSFQSSPLAVSKLFRRVAAQSDKASNVACTIPGSCLDFTPRPTELPS